MFTLQQAETGKMYEQPSPICPFVVSYPRSGSTLLRLMLDAHPDLAIPPETHLCHLFSRPYVGETLTKQIRIDILEAFTKSERWNDFHINAAELAGRIESIPDGAPVRTAIATLWELYAEKFGKSRWGDKTPGHMRCISSIASLFPQARFILIVRDLRDVICSMQNSWFGKGRSNAEIATDWVSRMRAFETQASEFEGRIFVTRYEDLVCSTETVLREICDFIDLPFMHVQLSYHKLASVRIAELSDLGASSGTVTAAERRDIHRLTNSPPTSERIGVWSSTLTKKDVFEIETIAAETLLQHGYDLSK
jgi:hypothetical protein